MRGASPAARALRRAGALALLALAATSAFAALEGYYRISGIGSSTDALLVNWRPFLSFSTQVTRPNNALRPNASEISLQKLADKQSPPLMQNVFSGRAASSAVLYFRNTGESFPVFVLNLKNVSVTGYRLQSEVLTRGLLVERIALSYDAMEASVTKAGASQTLVSTTTAWNFATNAAVTGTPPTLTLAATTLATNEDAPATMGITHTDDYSDVETLTRTATSSDANVVAPSGLTFSGTGSTRTLTVTPVANASGTATITVTLRDTAGLTSSSSFALTVNAVNDAPVVAPLAPQTTTVGTPRAITVTLSDADTPATALTLAATSDNATVLPPGALVLTGSGATRTLTLTPAAAGSATITLIANDGTAGSAPVTFTFIANPVGFGIPSDITLSANSVAENSAAGSVLGTLGVVDPDNASGHTYALVDDAGGRFALSGTSLVVANGSLIDYESAASHAITVRATDPDNHAFTRQLTIAVSNVNEPPVVAIGSLGAAAPGHVLPLTAISLADPDAGSADVRVEFSVLHGTLSCDTAGALGGKVTGNQTATLILTTSLAELNAAFAAGAVTYAPAAGFTGDDILQIVCADLGHTGSGGTLTDTRLAAIAVAVDSFAAWQALHFSSDELADPAVSGPHASPLADGFTNLLKYALGLDPHVRATTGPQFGQTSTNWTLTYSRPASRPDLTYAVEISTNLAAWTTTGVTHELIASDPNTGAQTWRASYPQNTAPTLFARLRVELALP